MSDLRRRRGKSIEVVVSVHKDVPGCCRDSLVKFAAADRYQGAGEPGDRIGCGCGNTLVYDHRGWRLAAAATTKESVI